MPTSHRRRSDHPIGQPGRKRTRLDLPHMDRQQAILAVAFLESVIDAIWRTHGDDMAEHPWLTDGRWHDCPDQVRVLDCIPDDAL